MLLKKAVIMLCFLTLNVCLKAQSPVKDSIKQSIHQMFYAMLKADTALLTSCFAKDAIIQTFARNTQNEIDVKTNTVLEFAQQVNRLPKDSVDEQIFIESIQVDGPLASVWTPYKLYFNKRFLHCGINHFVLARLNGIWKIQYIIDTRRKQGCGE